MPANMGFYRIIVALKPWPLNIPVYERTRAEALARVFSPDRDLLLRKHADATVAALRRADSARLQGHKCVIVTGIHRDAMRVRIGSNVLQPLVRRGVDDTHHWSTRHVAGRDIILVVAPV